MINAENRAKMVAGIRAKGTWNKKPRMTIPCACGCGGTLETPDSRGRSRAYITNHQTKTLVLKRKSYGPVWNLGMKMSDEYRAKLSAAHVGQQSWCKGTKGVLKAWNKGLKMGSRPASERLQISVTMKARRETLHLWKGGISQQPRRTQTVEWKIIRDRIYSRDNWTCQVCFSHCPKHFIICHHIVPVRHGGSNEDSNLCVVCKSCHSRQEWLFGTEAYHWAGKVAIRLTTKDNPRNIRGIAQ